MAEIKDDANPVDQHTAAATPSAPSSAMTSSAERCVGVNGTFLSPIRIYLIYVHANAYFKQ
jgi:hypothetical protein